MRVSLFVMVALGAFACGGRRSIDDAIPASIADADASTHSEASAVHARASDAMVASVSGAIDANMSDSADAGLSDGIDASGPLHVTSLAAGWKHTCALLSDGPARCWGDDTSEQLGVPTSSLPLGGRVSRSRSRCRGTSSPWQAATRRAWPPSTTGRSGAGERTKSSPARPARLTP